MVRETFRMRSWARAERPWRDIAFSSSISLSASRSQNLRICFGDIAEEFQERIGAEQVRYAIDDDAAGMGWGEEEIANIFEPRLLLIIGAEEGPTGDECAERMGGKDAACISGRRGSD